MQGVKISDVLSLLSKWACALSLAILYKHIMHSYVSCTLFAVYLSISESKQ